MVYNIENLKKTGINDKSQKKNSNELKEITKKAKAQQSDSKTKSHRYRNKENHTDQYQVHRLKITK